MISPRATARPTLALAAACWLLHGWAPAELQAGEDLPPPKLPPLRNAQVARLNLQLPESGIREQLLELTPKGTSLTGAIELLGRRLQREHPLPLGAGPVRASEYSDPTAGGGDVRKKRLVVFLGYRHRGIEISSRMGVTAFYAFDARNRLADVFIVRQEEPF